MPQNAKNWRILLAILLTSSFALFWQNCSEVQFGTSPTGINTKIGDGDLVVVEPPCANEDCAGTDNPPPPPLPPGDGNPPPPPGDVDPQPPVCESENCAPNPGGPDTQDPSDDPVAAACGIEIADVMLNLSHAEVQGDGQGDRLPLQITNGATSVKNMVADGLALKALANSKGNVQTIDLVLVRGDRNYILDTDGKKHILDTIASQGGPGLKIRLQTKARLEADGEYRLKLLAFPELKKHGKASCRLENNQDGSLE